MNHICFNVVLAISCLGNGCYRHVKHSRADGKQRDNLPFTHTTGMWGASETAGRWFSSYWTVFENSRWFWAFWHCCFGNMKGIQLVTRSSAIADKPRDAFRGQSWSPNIVPFHMLGMVSCYSAIVTLSIRHSDIRLQKNVVILKSGSEVTQGHWKWYHSIDWVWFPITVL